MNIERTPCNQVAFNSVLDTNASASLFPDEGQMVAKEDKDKTTGETVRFIVSRSKKRKKERRSSRTRSIDGKAEVVTALSIGLLVA